MVYFFSKRIQVIVVVLCLLLSSTPFCQSTEQKKSVPIGQLKFLGEYDVPFNHQYNNTTVGGLSGIDYDSTQQLYYLISDDRSAINPARYYTAKILFDQTGIKKVEFVNVTTLLAKNGKSYPDSKHDPGHTPDPEALRYNPVTHQMIWSSEGERIVGSKDTILENPEVTIITPSGKYIDTFSLPPNLHMQATEKGPRQNGVFEGLTFADNFKTLYVNVEEPLYEDGPRADITENNAWIRILKFDMQSKKNTAQYAYKLDPVAHPSTPAEAFMINGIPDILSIGDDKFIIIERSFSSGKMACTIKVFLTDISQASNIIHIPSLKTNATFHPAEKKLLLNMDMLGIYIDNIEGVTFGPRLPNGHNTLLFVADNNFNLLEKTQFLLFEVMP